MHKRLPQILLEETFFENQRPIWKFLILGKNRFDKMDFVFLPKFLLEEFIVLWRQVESISPTFSEDARKLPTQVRDTVARIEIQAMTLDRQSACTGT